MAVREYRTSRFAWNARGHSGWFRPTGTLRHSGNRRHLENPPRWESDEPLYAARIFVGFNVGDEKVWSLEDVVEIVREIRTEQVGNPGSTFLLQKGIYAHQAGGPVVEEDGAQVIILNLPDYDTEPAQFRKQIVKLAEDMARQLRQEEVIVEFQKGGLSERTMGVGV